MSGVRVSLTTINFTEYILLFWGLQIVILAVPAGLTSEPFHIRKVLIVGLMVCLSTYCLNLLLHRILSQVKEIALEHDNIKHSSLIFSSTVTTGSLHAQVGNTKQTTLLKWKKHFEKPVKPKAC